jgi:hypothetical protein
MIDYDRESSASLVHFPLLSAFPFKGAIADVEAEGEGEVEVEVEVVVVVVVVDVEVEVGAE